MKLSKFIPLIPAGLVLLALMFPWGCANTTTPPTGGDKDTIPPVITKVSPLPGTVNVPVHKAKVRFTFNEYVKIKDNMILLCVTEENGERLRGDRQMFRCDNLTLLQNYDRMYQVGRGYGDLCKDGKWRHINVAFCSYGSPPELPEDFLTRENPFTV